MGRRSAPARAFRAMSARSEPRPGVPVPGTKRPLIKINRPARTKTPRDLVEAAGHMGNAGRQMAELAAEMRCGARSSVQSS